MTLGERCDEIVRLIDETLASFEAEPAADNGPDPVDITATHPSRLAARTKASAPSTRRMLRRV
jgi:hypothetical protein